MGHIVNKPQGQSDEFVLSALTRRSRGFGLSTTTDELKDSLQQNFNNTDIVKIYRNKFSYLQTNQSEYSIRNMSKVNAHSLESVSY